MMQKTVVGQGVLIIVVSRSHSGTTNSVGFLWTSDQPDTETFTTTHNTHHRHPCQWWNSKPQSQQASDRNPTSLERAAVGIGNLKTLLLVNWIAVEWKTHLLLNRLIAN